MRMGLAIDVVMLLFAPCIKAQAGGYGSAHVRDQAKPLKDVRLIVCMRARFQECQGLLQEIADASQLTRVIFLNSSH